MQVRVRSALTVLMAALAPQIWAQTPQPAPEDHGAIHEEMNQLFKSVELRQRAIDRLLFDAGAGKVPKAPIAGSGIDKLLEHAREGSTEVKRDIDRILELARSHTHEGGT
jgi:hypothetical protein